MPELFKALSVRQPWAWAIAEGLKRIENRTWTTSYRGPLVIHASSNRRDLESEHVSLLPAFDPESLRFGVAAALVELVDVLTVRQARRAFPGDPFVMGPYCWVVEDPRPLRPLTVRGSLGIFHVPKKLIVPL
jgi:hypothetical protein